METKLFNFRLPIELMEAVKAKAGKTSMTDVVTVALSDYVAGGSAAAPDPRVAELEAQVADLKRKLTDALKAAVEAHHGKPAVTSHAEARRLDSQRSVHGNPVLVSAVPEVVGNVPWCGLKGLDKAKKPGR